MPPSLYLEGTGWKNRRRHMKENHKKEGKGNMRKAALLLLKEGGPYISRRGSTWKTQGQRRLTTCLRRGRPFHHLNMKNRTQKVASYKEVKDQEAKENKQRLHVQRISLSGGREVGVEGRKNVTFLHPSPNRVSSQKEKKETEIGTETV